MGHADGGFTPSRPARRCCFTFVLGWCPAPLLRGRPSYFCPYTTRVKVTSTAGCQ